MIWLEEKEYIDRKAMLDYIDDCIPRMISKKASTLSLWKMSEILSQNLKLLTLRL